MTVGSLSALAVSTLILVGQAFTQEDSPPPKMILIPAGPFTMGADEGGEPDEHPAHVVELSAFYIDRTEVTSGDYAECVAAKRCRPPRHIKDRFEAPDRPVVGVAWKDAKDYCHFRGKRLLTEAEWEKAARGKDGRTFPWGNDEPTADRGCFEWAEPRPCLPGSFPAGDSPYGVTDMAGGVWEWLADVYDPGYYPRSTKRDPPGGTCREALAFFEKLRREHKEGFTGSNPIPEVCDRTLRGGAWNYPKARMRSSNRVHHDPTFRHQVAGIRCGRDAKEVVGPVTPTTKTN